MERLLDGILDEEAFFLAALELDLDKNLDVKRQIEAAKRRVLIQAYYAREIQPYTKMTDEDLVAYYEENLEEFTKPEESIVRQVVLATEGKAKRVRSRLLRGADWGEIVANECVDEPTKKRSGRIGAVQKNASIIPFVGVSPELAAMIDTLTIGKISPVVKTGKGYHVITVESRNPETEVAFEKVRDTIERNYQAAFAEKVRKERVAALRDRFGARIVASPAAGAEEKTEVERSAAKIFALAQKTTDPLKRIKYYDEIVRNYPDDSHACEAQFMIGFVYAEELHDFDRAHEAFQKVLTERRDCGKDLVKNARWMIENMGKEPPPFEE